jgi:hypothetical protein
MKRVVTLREPIYKKPLDRMVWMQYFEVMVDKLQKESSLQFPIILELSFFELEQSE